MADAAVIVIGWALACRKFAYEADEGQALLMTGSILVFHFVGEITGMYRNWRGARVDREVMCGLLTWLVTLPILITGIAVFGRAAVDTQFLVSWLSLALACMLIMRIALRVFQSALALRGLNTRSFAIVGVNELSFRVAKNIEDAPEMGLKLAGFYDDRSDDRTPQVHPAVGKKVGDIDELVQRAKKGEVDTIYITFPMRAEDRIRNVLDRLADSATSVYIVPDFFVFELLHSRWSDIGGIPTVSVFENPFYGVDGFVKRFIDVSVGAILLVLLAIPMAVIAGLVKFSSPGPVFFRQRRYGLGGREILVWKFRSMRVCENGDKVTQATKNDSRVTPIGAILRKTSLDELPQLFNVLNGTMSLVGPRPHANAHNEEYRGQIHGYMLRHKVRPGITGLAQVNGYRGETDTLEKMERRIECDHQYIREWSLLMDIKILFRTIFVVFSNKNAY